ncbi:ATPase involved in DNA repair [Halobacillus sp. BAB-2008]|nr:ATPase involved in DNA repair [Halobacillus sp. BAB-2008]
MQEYKNFLKEYDSHFNEDERKIASLILNSFDFVESKTSARGNRAKAIVNLLDDRFNQDSDKSFERIEVSNDDQNIKQLSKLSVKNFRGFTDNVSFDLGKSYVFIYGPNGTGKSSMCEALEYSLLNTIYEAENKRITIKKYIQNAYTQKGENPVLYGVNNRDEQVKIKPNLQAYEFCFIERNRIEGFARVAANTPQTQQQRLATLFGLEEFNNFVRNFNDSIENYMDCEGEKEKRLKERQKQIERFQTELEEFPEKRNQIQDREGELLKKYPGVETLVALKEKINGESEGIIQRNNKEIAELELMKKTNTPNNEELWDLLNDFKDKVSERETINLSIRGSKEDLSLKELYNAILENEVHFDNNCPAWQSQVYRDGKLLVPVDPYNNARVKIDSFKEIIEMEKRKEVLDKEIAKGLHKLSNTLIQIDNVAKAHDFQKKEVLEMLSEKVSEVKSDEKNLLGLASEIEEYYQDFEMLKTMIIDYNTEVDKVSARKEKLESENRSHNNNLEEIAKINAENERLIVNKTNALSKVQEFEKENQDLIKEVENERLVVERNIKFSEAYKLFRNKLVEFNLRLPSQLAKDLNKNTLEIYNAINRYDHPSDLLTKLKLPENTGGKIEISCNGEEQIDALHVLSEGHLRCLGLAILLAKNINDELPFIIFDDVVNAIDDEHRRGIVETILEDEIIGEKQLVITTHGEEFVKELDNNIQNKKYNNLVNRFDFLKIDDRNKISVRQDTSRNYLIIAQDRLHENQFRDCLANCRRALESLLHRLWKRISKKYNIEVSVKLKHPNGAPDLMKIAQSLKKAIKQTNGEYSEEERLLGELIGDKYKHRIEWEYLNKGTHDNVMNTEFNQGIVKEIYSLLVNLDECIMSN